MRNIWLIARREYLERVRAKSFIIMTLLIPAFMFGVTVVPSMLMGRGSGEARHLVVIASNAKMGELIRQQLVDLSQKQSSQASRTPDMERPRPQIGPLTVDVETNISDGERSALKQKVKNKELDGAIFATDDALAAKKVSFITRDVSSFISNSRIENGLNEAVRRNLLKSKGLTEEEINSALQPVALEAESPTGKGNPMALFFTIFTMAMILYVTVLMYGINVMRAILEEKTSRIMEVMLSTAKPSEMMAGKILGVAGVGLTQIAIWGAMALVPSSLGIIAATGTIKGILSLKLIVFFAIFFLLGFAIYSTLCAAVGAMVNSEQEAQQLQFLIMMPLIAAVIIMVSAIENPGSPSALWGSLFPLTAPLIMFLRVAVQPPPDWQIALSIALMLVTVFVLIWLCGRIYRVGILMYGKKPTLPELMKWIRYA